MQGWNERPHECRGHALSKDGRRHEKKTAEKKNLLIPTMLEYVVNHKRKKTIEYY